MISSTERRDSGSKGDWDPLLSGLVQNGSTVTELVAQFERSKFSAMLTLFAVVLLMPARMISESESV